MRRGHLRREVRIDVRGQRELGLAEIEAALAGSDFAAARHEAADAPAFRILRSVGVAAGEDQRDRRIEGSPAVLRRLAPGIGIGCGVGRRLCQCTDRCGFELRDALLRAHRRGSCSRSSVPAARRAGSRHRRLPGRAPAEIVPASASSAARALQLVMEKFLLFERNEHERREAPFMRSLVQKKRGGARERNAGWGRRWTWSRCSRSDACRCGG